jgi:hypothetical protein
MQEVTVNKIFEVIHCDGWKHVIKKSEEDVTDDSKYFNLEIDYYDNTPEETWRKVGETQIISSLILPEFIKALQEFV